MRANSCAVGACSRRGDNGPVRLGGDAADCIASARFCACVASNASGAIESGCGGALVEREGAFYGAGPLALPTAVAVGRIVRNRGCGCESVRCAHGIPFRCSALRQRGVRKPWAKGCRSFLQRNPLLAAENRSFSSSRGYEIPVMQPPTFGCLHVASSATCGNMLCPNVLRTNSYSDEILLFSVIFGPARCQGRSYPVPVTGSDNNTCLTPRYLAEATRLLHGRPPSSPAVRAVRGSCRAVGVCQPTARQEVSPSS